MTAHWKLFSANLRTCFFRRHQQVYLEMQLKGPFFTSVARNSYRLSNKPDAEGALI